LKIWPKEIHIEHWVQAKEGGKVELKIIFTHSLFDGVRSIVEWKRISMGPYKELFL
jgi:hypothetical protein